MNEKYNSDVNVFNSNFLMYCFWFAKKKDSVITQYNISKRTDTLKGKIVRLEDIWFQISFKYKVAGGSLERGSCNIYKEYSHWLWLGWSAFESVYNRNYRSTYNTIQYNTIQFCIAIQFTKAVELPTLSNYMPTHNYCDMRFNWETL
jgi:hypothetical protein